MSTAPAPDVTIITPSLNQVAFVARAIESVHAQGAVKIQHLFVDGGSVDGTLEIARHDARLHLIEAPGSSSHRAMNIALRHARGAIVGFLNTDDLYPPGAFAAVLARFAAEPDCLLVSGTFDFLTETAPSEWRLWLRRAHLPKPALWDELTLGVPGFNAWFFRRHLLEDIGGLREQFDYAADRDLLIRACRLTDPGFIAAPTYVYRVHDESRTMGGSARRSRRIAEEQVALAAELVQDATAPAPLRRAARLWAARERARLARIELGAGRFGPGAVEVIRAMGDDPLWLLHVIEGVQRRRCVDAAQRSIVGQTPRAR
ncbi:MAG: glycosyltransferase [Alphaproteobacteria bacterium]